MRFAGLCSPNKDRKHLLIQSSALVSGAFSDLTLVCGEQTFKTHRLIVCSQSSVFTSLCAESVVRASNVPQRSMIPRLSPQFSGLINLNAHDLEAVTKMIEFLYTGGYSTVDTSPTFSLHTHAKIHALASQYQILGLVALSAEKFAAALRRVHDLEVYFQSIRDVYSSPLTETSSQSQQQSAASAELQSTNHSHALRVEVVDAALVELSKILSSPLVMVRFQEICTEVPQFHADFLTSLLETKIKLGNLMEEGEVDGADLLCDSCGPREEGYEIEVRCRGCGKECLYGFQ